jgi:SAM-dependent methyltransferase
MNDWTSGYVADVGYSFGYYSELNPLRSRLALLDAPWAPPKIETACELGFGQGVSVNVHAAASQIEWWGADFNPAHAAFARELAEASGANAHLVDQAFADFCQRPDLPDFDFIGLHGVWSWISDANRRVIVEFIGRKLKPGGLAYVSYNTLPGHAGMVPMRHLLVQHAEVMEEQGRGLLPRIGAALDFAERLLAQDSVFGRANPLIAERIQRMKGEEGRYLAHEYFNRDWQPMHFGEAAEQLADAKLSYVGSAHYLDHVEALNLSPAQQAFLAEIPDEVFRQTARDFLLNQQFRRDYFVKGPRRISPPEQLERLVQERFILTTPAAAVTMTAPGALGDATLLGEVYAPILDLLSDHKPHAFGELEERLAAGPDTASRAFQAITVLIGKGDVAPAQDASAAMRARTDRLNARLMVHALSSAQIGVLASPVTGGGIPVGRFQQLFLQSRAQGASSPDAWAEFAWACLAALDQRILKDGAALQTPEENLAELKARAAEFERDQLPILRAAMVA